MKNLIPVLATVMAAGAVHAADDNTEFKWGAELRTRYNWTENAALSNTKPNANNFLQRNKLHLTGMKGEKITGHISLINNMQWGKSPAVTTAAGPLLGQPSSANTNDTMFVSEAWGWWKATDNVSFKLGRSAMTIADGAVVSSNDWESTPRVFEGAGAILDYDFGRIGLFGVKAFDENAGLPAATGTSLNQDPERLFYGVSFDAKNLPDALKMANVHVLKIIQDENATANSQIDGLRYGLTVGGDVSNIDFKATYAANDYKRKSAGGSKLDIVGSMIDLGVGYKMPEMMNFRIGAQYHTDTGNDSTDATKNNSYDSFHYEKHKYAGLMNMVEWGNLNYIALDLSLEPMEKTTVALGYLMFNRTTDKAIANFTNGSFSTVGAYKADSKALGNELNLSATHMYGNGFSVGAIYGMFTPGEALKPAGATVENSSRLLLEAKMVF